MADLTKAGKKKGAPAREEQREASRSINFIDRLLSQAKGSANPNPILGTERGKELLDEIQLQKRAAEAAERAPKLASMLPPVIAPAEAYYTKTTYFKGQAAMSLDHQNQYSGYSSSHSRIRSGGSLAQQLFELETNRMLVEQSSQLPEQEGYAHASQQLA